MGARLENAKSLYLEAIRDGNAAHAIATFSGSRYTQHSTPVKDGREGFVEFFDDFIRRNPQREIDIIRGFEDGPYVFLHVLQTLNGGEYRCVTADIFKTDDDAKMIEHWDMITEWVDDTVSGHTQVDGPTEPSNLGKTAANKELVSGFLNRVMKNGEHDKLADYISPDTYIQHNPLMGDGLESFRQHLASLGEPGQGLVYQHIHNVIGLGNFVASLAKTSRGGIDHAVIDLFRVQDGRIVEHWDVAEPILPESEWVNTGKF